MSSDDDEFDDGFNDPITSVEYNRESNDDDESEDPITGAYGFGEEGDENEDGAQDGAEDEQYVFYVHGLLPVQTTNCELDKTEGDYSMVKQNDKPVTITYQSYSLRYPSHYWLSTVVDANEDRPFKTHPYYGSIEYAFLDKMFDMASTSFMTTTVGSQIGKLLEGRYKNLYSIYSKKSTGSSKPIKFKGNPCDWVSQWFDLLADVDLNRIKSPIVTIPPYITYFTYNLCTSTAEFDLNRLLEKDWLTDDTAAKVDLVKGERNLRLGVDYIPLLIKYQLRCSNGVWLRERIRKKTHAIIELKISRHRIEVTAYSQDLEIDEDGNISILDDDEYGSFGLRSARKEDRSKLLINNLDNPTANLKGANMLQQARFRFKHVEIKSLLSWTYSKINDIVNEMGTHPITGLHVPYFWKRVDVAFKCDTHSVRARRVLTNKRNIKSTKAMKKLLLSQFDKGFHSKASKRLLPDMTQFQYSQRKSWTKEIGYGFFPVL